MSVSMMNSIQAKRKAEAQRLEAPKIKDQTVEKNVQDEKDEQNMDKIAEGEKVEEDQQKDNEGFK